MKKNLSTVTGPSPSPLLAQQNQSQLIIKIAFAFIACAGIAFGVWFFFFKEKPTAQKLPPTYDDNLTTLQSFTQTDCETLSTCSIGMDCTSDKYTRSLRDERDGKVYRVRRFLDNHCWMIDNLAYGGGTDGAADYCLAKTEPAAADYWREANNIDNITATATNGLNDPQSTTPTLIGNCLNPAQNDSEGDPNLCTFSDFGNCGYLYNWAAATQDPTAFSGGDTLSAGSVHGLCPSGWQLPEALSDHSFLNLHFATGYTWDQTTESGTGQADFWQTTNQFDAVMSGLGFFQGDVIDVNGSTFYWTSTQKDSETAYDANFLTDSANPFAANNKSLGGAIRCVLSN